MRFIFIAICVLFSLLINAQEKESFNNELNYSDSILIDYYNHHYFPEMDEADSIVSKHFNTTLKSARSYSNSISFSHKAGYYTNDFSLQLSLSQPSQECKIYYSTDGSVPTDTSKEYTEPIAVTKPDSARYGFKAFVIRAVAYNGTTQLSKVFTNTYIIGEELFNRFSFPVISLVTDPDNFFDYDIGIYVRGATYDGTNSNWSGNNHQRGIDWERDVHIQYFTKEGDLVIDQDAGVRIHGGLQRNAAQKSLRLFARAEYGKSTFDYQLLPQIPQNSYDRFILRTSFGCWNNTIIKDGLSAQLIKGLGIESQEYRPVIVLLNGDYWGIQTVRDDLGTDHFENKYSIDKESVNIGLNNILYDGTVNSYEEIESIIDTSDLSSDIFYEQMENWLDIQNLINYFNAEIYLNNYDWPSGNRKHWNSLEYDTKLRWIFFDLDAAFNGRGGVSYNALHKATVASGGWPNPPKSVKLLAGLLQNPKFKALFVTNAAYLMNYYFDKDIVIPKIEEMKQEYLPEIAEHCVRWNFGKVSTWESNVKSNLIDFAKDRRSHVTQHYISEFGLSGTSELTLSCANSALDEAIDCGHIYINKQIIPTDNNIGIYFNDVNMELTAVAASGYEFERWSDGTSDNPRSIMLSEDAEYVAVFKENPNNNFDLVINEVLAKNTLGIMDKYGEFEDWFELYNKSNYPLNTAGFYLTNDLQLPFKWQLPESNSFAFSPHEYKVFFFDNETYQGELHTNFKLSTKGKTIAIVKMVNEIPVIINSLTYPPLSDNISYGKVEGTLYDYCKYTRPTPRLPNDSEPRVINHKEITVYPNPAQREITIKAQKTIKEISIWTINGSKVFNECYNKNLVIVSLLNLKQGIYVIDVKYISSSDRIKLIVN